MADKVRHYEITKGCSRNGGGSNFEVPEGTRFDAVEKLGNMHQEYLAEGLAKACGITKKEAESCFISIKYKEI
jgi:hypothetical protein